MVQRIKEKSSKFNFQIAIIFFISFLPNFLKANKTNSDLLLRNFHKFQIAQKSLLKWDWIEIDSSIETSSLKKIKIYSTAKSEPSFSAYQLSSYSIDIVSKEIKILALRKYELFEWDGYMLNSVSYLPNVAILGKKEITFMGIYGMKLLESQLDSSILNYSNFYLFKVDYKGVPKSGAYYDLKRNKITYFYNFVQDSERISFFHIEIDCASSELMGEYVFNYHKLKGAVHDNNKCKASMERKSKLNTKSLYSCFSLNFTSLMKIVNK